MTTQLKRDRVDRRKSIKPKYIILPGKNEIRILLFAASTTVDRVK